MSFDLLQSKREDPWIKKKIKSIHVNYRYLHYQARYQHVVIMENEISPPFSLPVEIRIQISIYTMS